MFEIVIIMSKWKFILILLFTFIYLTPESRLTGEFNKKMAEQKKNFQKQIDTVRKESKRDIDVSHGNITF